MGLKQLAFVSRSLHSQTYNLPTENIVFPIRPAVYRQIYINYIRFLEFCKSYTKMREDLQQFFLYLQEFPPAPEKTGIR